MLKLYFEDGPYPDVHNFFHNYVQHENVQTVAACDYLVSAQIKYGEYDKKVIQKGLNVYKNFSQKVIVFLVSDSSETFNVPENVLLFRTSVLKSKQKRVNLKK